MKIRLLDTISHGAKNSRYLILTKTGFRSVLLQNDKNYSVLDEVDINEDELDKVNDKWIERYHSFSRMKKRALSHLSKYKENVLKISENGYWESSSGEIKWYTHILPEILEERNLIESEYLSSLKETYEKTKRENKIHRGFKNLNSSQAFAFNFFQPIINENLFNDLLDFWHSNSKPICEFEKTIPDETQFDFWIKEKDENRSCSFEVKYTEQDFGTAPIDEKHHNKWKDIYKEKMDALCGKDAVSEEEFLNNYQLWRNILTANKYHNVCFLYPRFRKNDLTSKIESVKEKCEKLKDKIHILYPDEFVEQILSDLKYSEKLKKHYTEFKQKYLEII